MLCCFDDDLDAKVDEASSHICDLPAQIYPALERIDRPCSNRPAMLNLPSAILICRLRICRHRRVCPAAVSVPLNQAFCTRYYDGLPQWHTCINQFRNSGIEIWFLRRQLKIGNRSHEKPVRLFPTAAPLTHARGGPTEDSATATFRPAKKNECYRLCCPSRFY